MCQKNMKNNKYIRTPKLFFYRNQWILWLDKVGEFLSILFYPTYKPSSIIKVIFKGQEKSQGKKNPVFLTKQSGWINSCIEIVNVYNV